ncbi:MAG: DUF3352 domain-containing protein [Planctomycetota bacterium]|nr:DUF3352 domain-containing protein [Planctomycetota bacterium]MDA1211894.1 DUF3352 domain-containing protein [Planctomycetota bacterium]
MKCMPRQVRELLFSIIVVVVFGPAVRLYADESRPLTRLVASDVGICIEAHDLKTHVTGWLNSNSATRLKTLSFYQLWRNGDEFRKLIAARGVLQGVLNQPPEEWAGQLFGKSVIIALYPREGQSPAGVLLLEAENPEVVQTTIHAWNRAEQQKTIELTHRDQKYFSRTSIRAEREDNKRMFYWHDGATFAISDEEEMIHRVIELKLQNDASEGVPDSSLDQFAVYQKAMKSLTGENIISLFFNVEVWDRSWLSEQPGQFVPFFDLLRRTQTIISGVHWDQGLIVETVVHHQKADSSERFWGEIADDPSDWPHAVMHSPANTLILIAGRNEWSLLLRELANWSDVRQKQDFQDFRMALKSLLLGRDFFDDLLPTLSSDWGLFIVAPDEPPEGELPLQGLWLIASPKEDSTPSAPTAHESLDNLLRTSANLLAIFMNMAIRPETTITTHTDEQETLSLVWLDRVAGYQPAYAITDRYVWITSSLSLLRHRLNAATGDFHHIREEWNVWASKYFPSADFIVLLRVAHLRDALQTHREVVLNLATSQDPKRRGPLETKLAGVQELLQVIDGAFVTADWGAEQTRISFGLVLHADTSKLSQAD